MTGDSGAVSDPLLILTGEAVKGGRGIKSDGGSPGRRNAVARALRPVGPAGLGVHVGEPIPAILDTNVILRDMEHWVRRGKPTFLWLAGRAGTIRLFASKQVSDEIAEHLVAFAKKRNLSASVLASLWRDHYAPHIRFVDAGQLQVEDPRVRAVAVRDPDDVPTAVLALMLAPSLVLSDDRKDLVAPGIAAPDWFGAVRFGMVVVRGDALLTAVWVFGVLGVEGVRAAARQGSRLIRTPLGFFGFLLAAALLTRTLRSRSLSGETMKQFKEVAGRALLGGLRVMAEREQGIRDLDQVAVGPPEECSLARSICRELGLARVPLSRTKLVEALRLHGFGGRALHTEVRELLESNPAFVEVSPRRWELGRRLGSGEEPSRSLMPSNIEEGEERCI